MKLLSIPPRSPNISPVENIFYLTDRKRKSDAVEKNMMHKTYESSLPECRILKKMIS